MITPLSLYLLCCVFLLNANAVTEGEVRKTEISVVIPEKVEATLPNANRSTIGDIGSKIDGGIEDYSLDAEDPLRSEGQFNESSKKVDPSEVRTTGVPENEERTLESPPIGMAILTARSIIDITNETTTGIGAEGGEDISREMDLNEFETIPDVIGNPFDNTTINAEETGVHNSYTHPHHHNQGHSHGKI